MSTPDAWLSWSGGKDSALALRVARATGEVNIVGLLTTVTASDDRIAAHGVRGELLRAQADRLGLPVHAVELPSPCPNEVYEREMAEALAAARSRGVTRVVFGDLYLADVRAYREEALSGTGVRPEFPLWGRPVDQVAREVVESGIRAVLACVDTTQLDRDFVGRDYDADLLRELPDGVDRKSVV